MTDQALKAIERNVRTVEQSHNWADVAELRHWYVRDVRVLTASLAEVEDFRRWLWANHGCSIAALYGDDGQMQCGACLIDFKAWKLENILSRLFAAHKAKLAAVEAERDQLQTKLIETLNDVTRLLDQERRRWYDGLSFLGDIEGLAPEAVGDRIREWVAQ